MYSKMNMSNISKLATFSPAGCATNFDVLAQVREGLFKNRDLCVIHEDKQNIYIYVLLYIYIYSCVQICIICYDLLPTSDQKCAVRHEESKMWLIVYTCLYSTGFI